MAKASKFIWTFIIFLSLSITGFWSVVNAQSGTSGLSERDIDGIKQTIEEYIDIRYQTLSKEEQDVPMGIAKKF